MNFLHDRAVHFRKIRVWITGLQPGISQVSSSCEPIRQIASTRLLCRDQSRLGQQLRHSQQGVAADGEHRHETGMAEAPYPQLAHRPCVLAPTESLLDALANTLAGPIAPVASRARIDRRAASAGAVLGDVRGDAECAARGYELPRVIVFVPCQSASAAPRIALVQPDARLTLGKAGRFSELRIHGQALTVLHQHVRHVVELGQMALALAKELRLRLMGGYVRLVLARLTVEVHMRV